MFTRRGGARRLLRAALHKKRPSGVNSMHRKSLEQGGGAKVIKGTARRVIVVKNPEPAIFEEAIFIVREDALAQRGVSAAKLMEEARQVAAGYTRRGGFLKKLFRRGYGLLFAFCGAGAAGAVWLAVHLLI
jgi:hypothetical protein